MAKEKTICPDCSGNGEMPAGQNGNSSDHWTTVPCGKCSGTGKVWT